MRVIQVGLGGFGRSWAEIARATEGVELVAAVDSSPTARAWAIESLGLGEEAVFASLGAALDATAADAVLRDNPTRNASRGSRIGATRRETRLARKAAGDHHRRRA